MAWWMGCARHVSAGNERGKTWGTATRAEFMNEWTEATWELMAQGEAGVRA